MKLAKLLILPAAILAAVSCTTIKPETSVSARITPGTPGGTAVRTSTVKATVTGIDTTTRKVKLTTPDGKKLTVKAGPEVVNFPQIRVGDHLQVTLTEHLLVRMAKPGEKTADGAAGMVALAPVGAKPGAVAAQTYQVTGTVTHIDQANRQATLRFADGSTTTVDVRQDVDMTKHKVGEKVVIRLTESLAIDMHKP